MSLLTLLSTRPRLLLLVRIAPYPFNLLNAILSSFPKLSLATYTGTTAISLLKVILHTWFGSGIWNISDMHAQKQAHGDEDGEKDHDEHSRETIKMYSAVAGVIFCVVLIFYLHHMAKKALERAQAEAEREEMMEAGEAGQGLVEIAR